jgi:hypothetical protein
MSMSDNVFEWKEADMHGFIGGGKQSILNGSKHSSGLLDLKCSRR